MNHFRNGLLGPLLIIVIIICAALVVLNIFLNIKIKQYLPAYLDEFSRASGLSIELDEAGLDPFFRIKLSGLKVSDPLSAQKALTKIETLTIEPHLLPSLIIRKIEIGEIKIDNPVINYHRESLDRLLTRIGMEQRGGKESPVGIEKVVLKNARFELGPGLAFTSKGLVILVTADKSRDSSRINIRGNVRIFENDMDVEGTINLLPNETNGKLKIATDKIRTGPLLESLISARNIKGVSRLTFKIAEDMEAEGEVDIRADDKGSDAIKDPLGVLNFDMTYDKTGDSVHVGTLGFDVMDASKGGFAGDIDDVTGDIKFNLSGSASTSDLKRLSEWIPYMDSEKLTGSLKSDDLKIDGSFKKGDLGLNGDIALADIGFAHNSVFEITGLGCSLNLKQGLSGTSGYPFTSKGSCSAQKLFYKDVGDIRNITTAVGIEARDGWAKKELSLTNLNSLYMGGRVSGSIGVSDKDGKSKVTGMLTGENLDLKQAPKSVAPFDMEGNARSVTADIEGGHDDYKAGISFAVSDFTLRLKTGSEFKVLKAMSNGALDFEYGARAEEDKGGSVNEHARRIIVKGKGPSYENLSFGGYVIKAGKIDDLLFSLDIGGDWTLSTASQGSGFEVLGKDVRLEQFKEHIDIKDSGRRGFRGTIDGTGGSFKSVEFPSLSAEYLFSGEFVDLQKLSAQVGSIGELKTDDLKIGFGDQKGGYPYKITLRDGILSGFDNGLRSEGISASFMVNNPENAKTEWEGKITALKTDIFSEILEGLNVAISSSPEGIKLSGISGKFLNGEIKGGIDILTSDTPSRIAAALELENASLKSGDLNAVLGKAALDFAGTLPGNSLPEGSGKFMFENLNLKRQGLDVVYGGSLTTRTSGETLFIEDGFIRNEGRNELIFSGEMDNSLSSQRRLEITFPEFAITDAVKFLSPFMPGAFKEGRVGGSAGFVVRMNNLFDTGRYWNGSLFLKGASFAADVGGGELFLKDINGTITLKDEGKTENKLASLIGSELDLTREVYKKYLRSFKETPSDSEADHLRIAEIEYGILKFEDVECDLVTGQDKIGITKLVSNFFGGKLYGRGFMNLGGDKSDYNLSFLFNDISLDAISKRLSPAEEYITGRVNGLVWLSGAGGELGMIDGPFEFWSVSSAKEPREIGKALLDKLGVKERLILGSSRSYDNGEISGYIKDGVITFKKFNISNSILGIRNLSIQADPVKNSISISHLVSVIREIARRSQTGGPAIQTQ
ncbi:MAG: hypothetical protein ACHQ6U_04865 [Thermodesulfobacteriota bacterium]